MLPFLSISRPPDSPLTEADTALDVALRRDVEVLATDIGPRGTFAPKKYQMARQFLESALQRTGYQVAAHTFTAHDGVECTNLEVTLRGDTHPDEILVVGAHYDSVEGCPAANDNASGVAGVLAIARALVGRPHARTIRFVLFANEEPPFFNIHEMGSQLYAQACRKRNDNIRGMVCLETIGYYTSAPDSQYWPSNSALPPDEIPLPTVGDFIALVGPDSARQFISVSAAAFAAQHAFPLVAAAVPAGLFDQVLWSDHRGFNEAGYPGFMFTDTAPLRYPHYHKATDTPGHLNYPSMARVVRGTIGMVSALAGAE